MIFTHLMKFPFGAGAASRVIRLVAPDRASQSTPEPVTADRAMAEIRWAFGPVTEKTVFPAWPHCNP
jgi:hypothetical protein